MYIIKSVSLDFWGTLYEGGFGAENPAHPERVAILIEYLKNFGTQATEEEIVNVCKESDKVFFEKWLDLQQVFTNTQRVKFILNHFGLSIPAANLKTLVARYEEINPAEWPTLKSGARTLVEWLASRLPVVMISDTSNMSLILISLMKLVCQNPKQ